jgi:hypothetical protein
VLLLAAVVALPVDATLVAVDAPPDPAVPVLLADEVVVSPALVVVPAIEAVVASLPPVPAVVAKPPTPEFPGLSDDDPHATASADAPQRASVCSGRIEDALEPTSPVLEDCMIDLPFFAGQILTTLTSAREVSARMNAISDRSFRTRQRPGFPRC